MQVDPVHVEPLGPLQVSLLRLRRLHPPEGGVRRLRLGLQLLRLRRHKAELGGVARGVARRVVVAKLGCKTEFRGWSVIPMLLQVQF